MIRLSLLLTLSYWAIVLYGNTSPNIFMSHLDKENGLSTNFINQVTQDNQGFIWIATNDGLCKYETYDRIKVIYTDTSQGRWLTFNAQLGE